MKMALLEAKKAYCEDEIPVGCVIVHKNEIMKKRVKIVQLGMLR